MALYTGNGPYWAVTGNGIYDVSSTYSIQSDFRNALCDTMSLGINPRLSRMQETESEPTISSKPMQSEILVK